MGQTEVGACPASIIQAGIPDLLRLILQLHKGLESRVKLIPLPSGAPTCLLPSYLHLQVTPESPDPRPGDWALHSFSSSRCSFCQGCMWLTHYPTTLNPAPESAKCPLMKAGPSNYGGNSLASTITGAPPAPRSAAIGLSKSGMHGSGSPPLPLTSTFSRTCTHSHVHPQLHPSHCSLWEPTSCSISSWLMCVIT